MFGALRASDAPSTAAAVVAAVTPSHNIYVIMSPLVVALRVVHRDVDSGTVDGMAPVRSRFVLAVEGWILRGHCLSAVSRGQQGIS